MLWWTIQNLVTAGLMAGVVWLLCRCCRIGPVGRHALWLVVLVKLVTPPLIAWPWAVPDPVSPLLQPAGSNPASVAETTLLAIPPEPPADLGSGDAVIADDAAAEAPYPFVAVPDARAPASAAVEPPPSPLPAPAAATPPAAAPVVPPNWAGILLKWSGRIWLAGAIGFALIHLARIVRMLRVRRRSMPADPALMQRVEDLCERLGLRRVRVRVSAEICSPLIWCLFRPEMFWPAVLPEAAELSLKGLIVHELAHLKRGDHWVGWLELLAGCVWWWNPLYWYVRHQLRENAELACDAWVVETLPGGRRAYAEALLSVCENMSGVSPRVSRPATPMPALGVGTGGRRTLERRLAMILRERIPLRIPRVGWLMIGLLVAGTLPAWSQQSATVASEEKPTSVPESTMLSERMRVAVAMREAAPVASLPGEAQELIRKYEQQEAEARAEMEKRRAEQREQLVKQLRELQDRYTKAGQLDEAVAIRDRIRQLSWRGGTTGGAAAPTPFVDLANAAPFRDQIGRQIQVSVVGSTEGTVWGNDVYTDDSSIAAAAVHAGLLTPGQRGTVYITMLPGQSSYTGSTRNGVTSLPYGPWPASYRIEGPLHSYGPVPSHRTAALPDPGSLREYRDHVGMNFTFQVVGSTEGAIWGSGTYTDDSPLAVAAVHAGLVTPGETAVVRVTILPGQNSYEGSTKNGVTSYPYGSYPGSYQVQRVTGLSTPARGYRRTGASNVGPMRVLTGEGTFSVGPDGTLVALPEEPLSQLREQAAAARKADHPLVVARQVTGTTTGTVWGTDVYTDDSSIAAAAVHAGVLKDGEKGWVRITLLPGAYRYDGSTRNGVTSSEWPQSWGGSFRIERGSPPQSTVAPLGLTSPNKGGSDQPAAPPAGTRLDE